MLCVKMMLLGIDTGGTFTDFVLFDGESLRIHKVLSTPNAPDRAILQGIADLGMHCVGKIQGSRSHRQVDDITPG